MARFQLGFLELTSGNFAGAEATWAPLDELPDDHALRMFATGLRHFARDEFPKALEILQKGVRQNTEYAPINADMQLIIETTRKILTSEAGEPAAAEPISSTHMLLQQYAAKNTKH